MDKKYTTIFTTTQLAALLNIPMRKILSYIERGYIVPSFQDASGHGTKRLWTGYDAVKVYIIKECEEIGIRVERMRGISKLLVPDVLKNTPRIITNKHGDILPSNTSIEEFDAHNELDPDPSVWIVVPIRAMRDRVYELMADKR